MVKNYRHSKYFIFSNRMFYFWLEDHSLSVLQFDIFELHLNILDDISHSLSAALTFL